MKPILRDHCHERPPVLKDHTLLAEGPTYLYNWTSHQRRPVLTDHIFLWPMGWSIKTVCHKFACSWLTFCVCVGARVPVCVCRHTSDGEPSRRKHADRGRHVVSGSDDTGSILRPPSDDHGNLCCHYWGRFYDLWNIVLFRSMQMQISDTLR